MAIMVVTYDLTHERLEMKNTGGFSSTFSHSMNNLSAGKIGKVGQPSFCMNAAGCCPNIPHVCVSEGKYCGFS